MSPADVYPLAAVVVFALGLRALIAEPDLIRKLIAINVMAAGVFVLLVDVARRGAGPSGPDPVPHAMVLTGIVVAVSVTAYAVALARALAAAEEREAEEP